MKLLKGEWWENTDEGLPLFQQILGKAGIIDNISIVDSLIKEVIINTKDVTEVSEFSSNYEDRKYSFKCTVSTKYGNTAVALTL